MLYACWLARSSWRAVTALTRHAIHDRTGRRLRSSIHVGSKYNVYSITLALEVKRHSMPYKYSISTFTGHSRHNKTRPPPLLIIPLLHPRQRIPTNSRTPHPRSRTSTTMITAHTNPPTAHPTSRQSLLRLSLEEATPQLTQTLFATSRTPQGAAQYTTTATLRCQPWQTRGRATPASTKGDGAADSSHERG